MRESIKIVLVFSILLMNIFSSKAQLHGNNLFEYEYGQIPIDTFNFNSAYNRLFVSYDYNKFKAFVTLEQYYTKYLDRNYTIPTQYGITYNSKYLDVKVGTFQETLGRGLLLRSFEIPGAVLEDISYRSRYYFQRDILGGSALFKLKNFNAKFIYGKPLNNVFPPNEPNSLRRSEEIFTGQLEYNYKGHSFAVAAMQLNDVVKNTYGMMYLSGNISNGLSYYGEFSKNLSNNNFTSDWSFDSSQALYLNLNYYKDKFGITAEYKYYNEFVLGTGINEPPALIKQHVYRTLNRSTHVPQPLNESGTQIEAVYNFNDGSVLTFNNAFSNNDFGKEFLFQEYFLEYSLPFKEKWYIKSFVDFAQDPFKLEKDRISFGVYSEYQYSEKFTYNFDTEAQFFERLGDNVLNGLLNIGVTYKNKLIINILTELSNDPVLTNELEFWIGLNSKYQISQRQFIQLFAGKRRGGPACNAGICYEILDFKGIEVRYVIRF